MMKAVSDFLYAQTVQHPIELFSDWLNVGHVDEFMAFVPANNEKGFCLVLSSPDSAYQVLDKLVEEGHGDAVLLESKRFEQSVASLAGDTRLRKQNKLFQEYIDWNKRVLVDEMGLSPTEIVQIPGLYFASGREGRADAYFPGMVNMLVLNRHLAIPKPFGPTVGGVCAFEAVASERLEPLGLTCHYVDTYAGYHLALGEVHCGTNVVREPMSANWWDIRRES